MPSNKEKKKNRSIYMTDTAWESLKRFAITVGYGKTSEMIVDTALMIMKYEDLHWIYDRGELLKEDPEYCRLKIALYKITDDVLKQLQNQGTDISGMQTALKETTFYKLGDDAIND